MCLFTGIHYFGTGPRSEIHLLNVNDVKRVSQEFKMKNIKPIFHKKTGWRRVKFASPNA